MHRLAVTIVALAVVAAGCDGNGERQAATTGKEPHPAKRQRHTKPARQRGYKVPPLLNKKNVYAADVANRLSPKVRNFRSLIYVPNSLSNTVDEINPRTFKIVRHFKVGALPQHVVPSYDLKTLWVNDDKGNSLTPINPRNGKPGKPVPVRDPYNLYFTPDGRYALVMAEAEQLIDFRDPHSMKLRHTLKVPTCPGLNHADFSKNGRLMLVSCEFSGRVVLIDVPRRKVLKTIPLEAGAAPQDVKLSPDGRVFYIADMIANGVWKVSARTYKPIGFIPTGLGAHGLYASRDARYLYVSNRRDSSISLISFKKRKQVRKWRIPGGATPDMGGVSTNGKVLWLAGRYSSEVYAINTRTGKLIKRIKVGLGPHGLCVYPQPGRYSLGHTGVFR
jgi:DNA-binding beta-propeller fold protein YncE